MLNELATENVYLGEARVDESLRLLCPLTDDGEGSEGTPLGALVPDEVLLRESFRRSETRYLAKEEKLWMQWWQGDEYLGRPARLVNVSRNGAMLLSSFLFIKYQSIRIFLDEPAPQVGVEATVFEVIEGVQGLHQVRLRLQAPCPDLILEIAVGGLRAWMEKQPPNNARGIDLTK